MLFGSLNLSNTASALNLTPSPTDLISCAVYAVAIPIVLGKSTPFICICSPTLNYPEVSFNLITVELLPAPTANPLAPLFFPFTNDPAGSSVLLTD